MKVDWNKWGPILAQALVISVSLNITLGVGLFHYHREFTKLKTRVEGVERTIERSPFFDPGTNSI